MQSNYYGTKEIDWRTLDYEYFANSGWITFKFTDYDQMLTFLKDYRLNQVQMVSAEPGTTDFVEGTWWLSTPIGDVFIDMTPRRGIA
jgi:hypothetical protein